MARALFILKKRSFGYGHYNGSGLHNSSRYVQEMLLCEGIPAKLVHVVDNNDIDREVALFRPTHVFIEAYWVVPEKFDVLRKIHPRIRWIVRNHSEIPFLAMEGMVIDWTLKYVAQRNVLVSSNSPEATSSFRTIIKAAYPGAPRRQVIAKTPMLTNVYPPFDIVSKEMFGNPLHVGCFGAIRPLKNHLLQAVAAIRYAEGCGRQLFFHINSTRVEGRAEPILSNLRHLFEKTPNHELVEHGWMNMNDYRSVLRDMHIVMQVSFSETFNFVSADAISEGTPIVVSDEVPWAVEGIANPNDDKDMAEKISDTMDSYSNLAENGRSLLSYIDESKSLWMDFLT